MDENRLLLGRHEAQLDSLAKQVHQVWERLDQLEAKIDRLQWWLVALLGSVTTGVILLAADLLLRR